MAVTRRVLVTVSGAIPDGVEVAVAERRRPRVDYLEMAQVFDADLLDHPGAAAASGRLGRLIGRVAGANAVLAWRVFRLRNRYDVILTDGEQIGLPYALLAACCPRPRSRHLMIVHIMSVPKKEAIFKLVRRRSRIDELIVYSSAQREHLIGLGVQPEQVTLSHFMVDTSFFDPEAVEASDGPITICSAGLELRDYPTMVEAVRGLEARVVLAAASPWSKRPSALDDVDIPDNVEIVRLDLHALRQLYADSTVVVMPLQANEFQAGITTILEAMAMAKPVVCSATAGQTDVITDQQTGAYVPVGDAVALRSAIERLISSPAEAARIGAAARHWVVESADIAVYVRELAARVDHWRTRVRQ